MLITLAILCLIVGLFGFFTSRKKGPDDKTFYSAFNLQAYLESFIILAVSVILFLFAFGVFGS